MIKTQSNIKPNYFKLTKLGEKFEVEIAENIIELQKLNEQTKLQETYYKYEFYTKLFKSNNYDTLVRNLIDSRYDNEEEKKIINLGIEFGKDNIEYKRYRTFVNLVKEQSLKYFKKI